MKPKLVMTPLAPYQHAKFSGKNESGIIPIGDRVLILPDDAADKTAGGIMFDDTLKERNSLAAETGVLVAVGNGAWFWNSDRTRKFEGVRPEVGQRVWFERYAGSVQHGNDGRLYRLMDDKCIGGLRVDTTPAVLRPNLAAMKSKSLARRLPIKD